MLNKIDHIGIAVTSLAESRRYYQDVMKMDYLGTETVEEQEVTVAIFQIGETRIELLAATSPTSPIAGFIARRGPGIHHIAYQVDDLTAALTYCASKGLRLIDQTGRPGANGATIAFLHPKSTDGILTELTTGAGR